MFLSCFVLLSPTTATTTAVVELLKKHFETDPGAAFTGCKALYYLTYGCLGNVARVKAAGGLELMQAIVKHPACNTRVLGKGRMASKEAQYVLEKLGGSE